MRPACRACSEAYTYEDRGVFVCPMWAHEWTADADDPAPAQADAVISDAADNPLADGDTVTVVKDGELRVPMDAWSFREAKKSDMGTTISACRS